MKMTLVLFWLCSGFFYFTFASYRLRHFSIGDKKDWKNSLDECKEDASSFVTVYDDEDAMFVWNYTKHIDSSRWLGLHRNILITKNTWSNGNPLMVNYSSVNVSDWTQECEAIGNNTWRGFNCSERNYFMCYKGNNYTLVENKKDWCQALQYCRKHFTDLVSISNPEQNKEVIAKGNGTTFWIGLRHDNWEWVDKGCSSFRKIDNTYNNYEDENCTALRRDSKVPDILYQFGCYTGAHSFCSKGTVRIKVIGEKKTWEEAFDYCREHHTDLLWIRDRNDSYALDQWLNQSTVDGPFWIGLRQSRVFGFWIWTSESNNAVTWDNWKNGEAPQLPLSDHCAVINETDRTSDGGVWSDENCLVKHHFLCEEKIFFMN
ncbi:macrophage mannose receptor 1 [Larimichthys crocea]|uniref:macrophage mannose receptor 1 n=1 Tax=Larimichthys crocea TaxID=215358 RepID=UPI000F5D9DAD|nr:macrophage mannose receptor 1 [Larimichthys crocea]